MPANPPGWHILTPNPGQPNASQITRARETLTLTQPQNAKFNFKKCQAWGVGYICLLGGDPTLLQLCDQNHRDCKPTRGVLFPARFLHYHPSCSGTLCAARSPIAAQQAAERLTCRRAISVSSAWPTTHLELTKSLAKRWIHLAGLAYLPIFAQQHLCRRPKPLSKSKTATRQDA
jgi:hypothetical protein